MHDSWVALLNKIEVPVRMLWIMVAYRRGDSGWPWRAWRTGRTWPTVIGGRRSIVSHHDLKGASIVTYRGAVGGGASAKALVASAPKAV